MGYRLSFVSTSGLSEPDNGTTVSTITVEAPANVVFPADSACYQYNVTDEATGSEDGCAPLQSGSGTNEITLATPNVSPGDQVLVFIDGITGAARKGSGKVTLWTTSDPKPTDVKAKTVASASVGQPDLTTSADGADYQVGFVATAGLSQPDNGVVSSTITLDAATGTEFPADSSCSTYIVTDLTNGDQSGCSPLQSGSGTNQITLETPDVSPGDQVLVAVEGVTDSPADPNVKIWTTADPTPTGPISPDTLGGGSLGSLSFTTSSADAGATEVTDQLRFTAPQTPSGAYTITLDAPSGTVFPASGYDSRYLIDDLTTGQSGGGGLNNYEVSGTGTNDVGITDNIAYESPAPTITAGDQILVTVNGVVNPTAVQTGDLFASASFATSPITVSDPTTSSSAVSNVAFTTTSPEAGATQVTDQFPVYGRTRGHRHLHHHLLDGPVGDRLSGAGGQRLPGREPDHRSDGRRRPQLLHHRRRRYQPGGHQRRDPL